MGKTPATSAAPLDASIPLFRGIPQARLQEFLRLALRRPAARGETIFQEGEPATGFFIVLSGKVKIFKLSSEGKEQILHWMGPGDPFGEVAVFVEGPFPASAEAVEKSDLLFLSRRDFAEAIRQEPALAMNMLGNLSRRLLHLTRMVETLALQEVPQRLAAYLLRRSALSGESDEVALEMSKGELARFLGTIPETLSRVLARMSRQGVLALQGRRIRILDRQQLRSMADMD